MKTPKGEGVKYFVNSAKQAKRLEDAVNDLPLILEIDSFSPSFKPPIFVSEKDINEILIQPSQGRFSKIEFEEKVNVTNLSDYKKNCSPEKLSGLLFFDSGCVVNHEKRIYYIINNSYYGV
ncbi:hypothetical protein KAR52_00675 [Candidatus Pacearchaeota archaeon]|nr:hypothetical protein [Candidatus Pacearchaeota archaeon]